MGDCRIRIVIAKCLFGSLPDELTAYCDGDCSSVRVASNKTSVSFVRMYSADTTIREVVDENILLRKIFLGNDSLSQSSSKETETITEATSEFTLWDCTLSPPRDITSWPRQDYPDLQGLKSKTLHAAGLFPSGTWMVIPKGMTPNNFSGYDSNVYVDVQYNNNNGDSNDNTDTIEKMNTNRTVEFNDPALRLDTSTPLPSQVMETVSTRFAAEERAEELKRMETSESSITALRRENIQLRAQKELERVIKLERRIAMLEEQSNNNKPKKKKKALDQVLRMLVKSRATGDKNLKDQDRFYFQCLILYDDNVDTTISDSEDQDTTKYMPDGARPSKEYRYFSPQDTFAKIANSVSNGRHKENKEFFSEVLCRRLEGQIEEMHTALPVYRRFPMTMRVYEAKSRGYLSLSENITNYFDDTLIIRCYIDREDATPLIQDETILHINNKNNTNKKGITDSNDQMTSTDAAAISISTPTIADKKTNTASNDADTTTTTFEDTPLSDAIRQMDDANKTGSEKGQSTKKSAAALKVRQMKMKSKAKGNKKLKIEDRVFLEVVLISEIGRKPICECYFLSKKDPIERILQWIGGTGTNASSPLFTKNVAEQWEFLVPQDDSRYRPIATTSIAMKEAEEIEILKSFDRIILRPKSNQ
jgi:hypothetical protein